MYYHAPATNNENKALHVELNKFLFAPYKCCFRRHLNGVK